MCECVCVCVSKNAFNEHTHTHTQIGDENGKIPIVQENGIWEVRCRVGLPLHFFLFHLPCLVCCFMVLAQSATPNSLPHTQRMGEGVLFGYWWVLPWKMVGPGINWTILSRSNERQSGWFFVTCCSCTRELLWNYRKKIFLIVMADKQNFHSQTLRRI